MPDLTLTLAGDDGLTAQWSDVETPFNQIKTLLNTTLLTTTNVQTDGLTPSDIRTVGPPLGNRIKVRNDSGAQIAANKIVYFSGIFSSGGNDWPTIALADSVTRFNGMAITEAAINDGADGTAQLMGALDTVDTSGATVTDPVYLSTAGGWTLTRPSAPDLVQVIGRVIVVDAAQGRIYLAFGQNDADIYDMDGNSLILDADGDTYFDPTVDDTIDFYIAGALEGRWNPSGYLSIGSNDDSTRLFVRESDASNGITEAFRISHATSLTPADDIGVALGFEVETSASNYELGARLDAIATTATAAAEDFALSFKLMLAGAAAAEVFRLSATDAVGVPSAQVVTPDETPWGLTLTNSTYSATANAGLVLRTQDSGAGQIRASDGSTTYHDILVEIDNFIVTHQSALTNAVGYPLVLDHQTSGTPANNIGTGLRFDTETAAGNTEIGATVESIAIDTTATSEDFDLVFKTMAAGAAAAERFRIGLDILSASPLGVNTVSPTGNAQLFVDDDGNVTTNYPVVGIRQDDANVLGLVVQNETYSADLRDGLQLQVDDAGIGYVNAYKESTTTWTDLELKGADVNIYSEGTKLITFDGTATKSETVIQDGDFGASNRGARLIVGRNTNGAGCPASFVLRSANGTAYQIWVTDVGKLRTTVGSTVITAAIDDTEGQLIADQT